MKFSLKYSAVFALLVLAMLSLTASVKSQIGTAYLSAIDSVTKTPKIIDLKNPISTYWHELYPHYSIEYHLTSWEDSDLSGDLSPSDQIDMTLETEPGKGNIYWFHVDDVMITIHWTWKDVPPDFDPTDPNPVDTEPETSLPDWPLTDPVNTQWHMIYPQFSRTFNITSWQDSNSNGVFDPSDQFDITFTDGLTNPPGPYWAHLDAVSTDIIVTHKSTPSPIPEFPLAATLELALAVTVVYIWLKRKPKISAQ